jgi:hypothetical protein
MPRLLGLAIVLGAVSWSLPARAHPIVDEARAAYEGGDFAAAIVALDAMERDDTSPPPSLDELLAALEIRVLAQRALGDEAAADRALDTIAALRPDHRLGEEIPPVLLERFATFARASGAPPRIVGVIAQRDGGATITARVEDDRGALVRAIWLRARVGGGSWQDAVGGAVEVRGSAGAPIEWSAEAIGPARATVASGRGEHRIERGDAGGEAWPWLVGGGAVLAVTVVVVIVVVAASGVDTQVDGPIYAELTRF